MEYINYLTEHQVCFLDSYKPISLWYNELYNYFEKQDFDLIFETLSSYNRYITYEEFRYIGMSSTIIIDENHPDMYTLYNLQNKIYKVCKNHHYRMYTRVIIKDYKLGLNLSLEFAIQMLNDIYNLYI
jgi:hypothetical protein